MLLPGSEPLARLGSFDTVSDRPTKPAVDWIAAYLDRPGLRVVVQERTDRSSAGVA